MTEDSQRLERIEDMLTQLIKTVGSTNSMVTHLQSQMSTLQTQVGALEQKVVNLQGDMEDVKKSVYRTEHSLNIMERRQDKMTTRIDNVEAEVEILSEGRQ